MNQQQHPNSQLATFGAGCFWHTEAAFRKLPGIIETSVGYMGGHFKDPCYLDVLSRITGHAEVAQIKFDPDQIDYQKLLETFWAIHDPTSLNRQGADRGEQYRSVIFCHTTEHMDTAHQSRQSLDTSGHYNKPIVTEIKQASDYWLATEEHQQYFEKKHKTTQAIR